MIMSNTTTRRFFLLCSAIGARLSAQQGDKTIISPRIIASFVSNQGKAETTLHVVLAKFELDELQNRIRYSILHGNPLKSGSPSDIACTAFLLVKSPTASLTPRGRVMSVVMVNEVFQWPDPWAVDAAWDPIENRWLFAVLRFDRFEVEITIFDPTGLDAFPFPLSFAPTWKSPWPYEPPSLPKHSRRVKSHPYSIAKLSLACLRESLIVTVAHKEEGLLISSYDRALRKWSDLPNAKAAELP
jgi:hypothetical protein